MIFMPPTLRRLKASHEQVRSAAAPLVWGYYLRISDDRTGGAEGVERQRPKAEEYIAKRGGTIPEWARFVENDKSAYQKKRVRKVDVNGVEYWGYRVIRPVWHRALAALREGKIDALAVYDLDRLGRDNRDLEDAIEVAQYYSGQIHDVAGFLDLMTENGRMAARMLMASAAKSSADTARRVKDWHVDRAEKGLPVGGVRPFGWTEDKLTLHPVEAPRIRELAQQILAGAGIATLCNELNKEGIKTPRDNEWRPKSLRTALMNPRLAGFSARKVSEQLDGKTVQTMVIVEGGDGKPVMGVWEPILDVETWQAVCDALATKTPRQPGHSATKYLLSGIARCGKCFAPLRGLPRKRAGGRTTFTYICHSPANGGCSGVARLGPPIDERVKQLVFELYEREAANRPNDELEPWHGQERLREIQDRMATARAAFTSGDPDMPLNLLLTLLKPLEAEEAKLAQERTEYLRAAATAAAPVGNIREDWDSWDLARKRDLITRFIEGIVIHSANGGKASPEMVEIVPRQPRGASGSHTASG